MSQPAQVNHSVCRPELMDVDGFQSLVEMALDIRSTWNHAADEIWNQLDPDLWELTHNPWAILQTASRERIEQITANPQIRKTIKELAKTNREIMETSAWFQQTHPQSPLTCVAYFSMEFMLSEALPIYSGGLGNVAGDQLKAANDLGVPVIGIGLLYQRGYFRQLINKEGAQQAFYPYNDPGQLPITPVRYPNGEWLRLKIDLPGGYTVWLRAWQVQIGKNRLYLLDSNDLANFPAHQGITSELYGGGPELRLQQEMILGIGGWRLLKALGITPEVCHLNEGHAALAVLERARDFMETNGLSFDAALAVTRAGNLFTTHTAVTAGFDLYSPALIKQYLGRYAHSLGISIHDLLAFGRIHRDDATENFNMAYLAIRGSGAVNGVSRLHQDVSQRIFRPLFPRWPQQEIPVGHITNGVHMPSWDSPMADDIWTESCGKGRWLGTTETLEQDIQCISDAELWDFRGTARNALVEYARQRLTRHLAAGGSPLEEVAEAKQVLDPNFLTLGFARRFATYKRPDLLLHDPERLLRLLTDPKRPVQLIIAGKAHPADREGQALIRKWVQFIRQSRVRKHAIFLSDYDMLLTERLVQGVDVWINTPRRPWEACGTSGMKVLVNGGINLSELDGWWAEAYSPEVGWALGDGHEHDSDPSWDAAEAEALYNLLEQEVVPEFYQRDNRGIPTNWVSRMRESMAKLTPVYSAERAVRQYTEEYYLPAATAYTQRAESNGREGQRLADWQRRLRQCWEHLRFGELKVETVDGRHFFEVQTYCNDIDISAIRVELYAEGTDGGPPVLREMQCSRELVGAISGYVYCISVSAERPASDYTVRIVPHDPIASIPLEAEHILWQR